jgi:hypothetical protein
VCSCGIRGGGDRPRWVLLSLSLSPPFFLYPETTTPTTKKKEHEIIIIKFEYISIQMKMEKRPAPVARVLEKSGGSDQRESFNRLCPAALHVTTARNGCNLAGKEDEIG